MEGFNNDNILNKYLEKYVEEDFKQENFSNIKLIWCNFKDNEREMYPIDELSNYLPIKEKIYFYNDREQKLYLTSSLEFTKFINDLEPWDEVDGVLFDDSYEWTIAVTHEDFIIVIGL